MLEYGRESGGTRVAAYRPGPGVEDPRGRVSRITQPQLDSSPSDTNSTSGGKETTRNESLAFIGLVKPEEDPF
jgi:hypothetical protein